MQPHLHPRVPKRQGGVLIAVLAYVAVIGLIMAGVLSVTVSHYSRARSEKDYANALSIAEAGVNYEINKISVTPDSPDQSASPATQAVSDNYSQAAGSFSVYIVARNGNQPPANATWTSPGDGWIVSTGTVNGITRTVRVGVKAYTASGGGGQYAVFGVGGGIINGTPTAINGNVGTDGGPGSPANTTYGTGFAINGQPSISGNVVFAGTGAGWQAAPTNLSLYTVAYRGSAENFQTVDQIAQAQFGSNPYTYLASNNDNALANPPIAGQTVLLNGNGRLTFVGKPGGANYYLQTLICNANAKVEFDNTNGPITLWFGPGATSSFVLNGGTALVKTSTNPDNVVKVYSASSQSITLNGNDEMDLGVYNYNGHGTGSVKFNGNNVINGSIITNTFTFNGTPTINYVPGYFNSSGSLYFGALASWSEQGGVN